MHSAVQTVVVTIISYKPLSGLNFARYTGQYGSYMPSSPLVPFNCGSREVLMTLGWLLHKSKLTEKLYAYHLEMADATQIPFRAKKACAIRGIVKESESIEAELSEIMNDLSQIALKQKAVDRHQPNDTMVKIDEELHNLAWMKGRLRAKWNGLHSPHKWHT